MKLYWITFSGPRQPIVDCTVRWIAASNDANNVHVGVHRTLKKTVQQHQERPVPTLPKRAHSRHRHCHLQQWLGYPHLQLQLLFQQQYVGRKGDIQVISGSSLKDTGRGTFEWRIRRTWASSYSVLRSKVIGWLVYSRGVTMVCEH